MLRRRRGLRAGSAADRLSPDNAAPPFDLAGDAIRASLARGAPIRVRARGTSMRPLLPSGTEVLIAPLTPATDLHVGDVVLTSVGERGLLLHRIVALSVDRGSSTVTTRGDGRRTADLPVERARVLGVAVEMTRGARTFRLDTPLWRALGYAAAKLLPRLWFLRRG